MKRNTTKTVDAIGKLNFTGNVIPKVWYQRITFTNKRGTYPHLLAINILAELIFWHRPTTEYDESTGRAILVKKRFKADKLQKNYKQLSEQFGTSYKLTRQAVVFLRDEYKLITTETKTVKRLQNVMFMDLVVENIKFITFSKNFKGVCWLLISCCSCCYLTH